MNGHQPPTQPDPGLPAGLAGELRGLCRVPVSVETRVDEAVLAIARERAAVGARRVAGVRRMTRWGMVAAAGLAVGVFLIARTAWQGRSRPGHITLAQDINGDGVVDILDALALERAIEAQKPNEPRASATGRQGLPAATPRSRSGLVDLNGDGVVDRRDVDLIAMQAVGLGTKVGGHG